MLIALCALFFGQRSVAARPIPIPRYDSSDQTVVLYRGAQVQGQIPAYDVEDTTLDSQAPNASEGGFYTLSGGSDKTILIRFGDLSRAIPANAEIISATLVLTESGQNPPAFQSAYQMLHSWGEGPALTMNDTLKMGGDPVAIASNEYSSATWESPHYGVKDLKWDISGGTGIHDATPIPSAHSAFLNSKLSIYGLGPSVAQMAGAMRKPGSNHGFALLFNSAVDFDSSESLRGKPRLIVHYQLLKPQMVRPQISIDIQSLGSHWQAKVEYPTALNIGAKARWLVDGRLIQTTTLPPLGALSSEIYPLNGGVSTDSKDPRHGKLTFELVNPSTGQILASQSVFAGGFPISVSILGNSDAASHHQQLASDLESCFSRFNQLCLDRSRYSFAPSGCIERIRLGKIHFLTRPISSIPIDTADVENQAKFFGNTDVLKKILLQLGAEDLSQTEFPSNDPRVQIKNYNGAGLSWYPGLTGGGDIRYEGSIPNSLALPEQPSFSTIVENSPIEPYGPVSLTNVGILNQLAGLRGQKRAQKRLQVMRQYPNTGLVRCFNLNGREIRNAILTFYPMSAGKVTMQNSFQLNTGDSNSVLLPSGNVKKPDPLRSGHPSGPGAMLVQCVAHGSTSYAWIKDWQLRDSIFRGTQAVAFIDLYFSMPSSQVNLKVDNALGESVTDSGNDPATSLSSISSDGKTPITLSSTSKKQAWIQIDLNRDRPIAEVLLTIDPKTFWKKFAIKIYGTGDSPDQARVWSLQENTKLLAMAQGWNGVSSQAKIALYGSPTVARFIRIVSLEPGNAVIYKISVYSALPIANPSH